MFRDAGIPRRGPNSTSMTASPSPTDQVGSSSRDEISLWEVLLVLLRRRRLIVGSVLVVAVLTILVTLISSRDYTTVASFRPQGSSGGSELAALASQFGVRVPMGVDETESPEFYAELVTSRQVLVQVASGSYQVDGADRSLVEILDIEEDTPGLEEREVIEWLQEEALRVSTGRETGIVHVRVTTDDPDLSFQVAARLLDEVSRFNLETRQSQAAAERAFIEDRVRAVQAELLEAEESLLAHIQNNRQIGSSPELQFERDRLQEEASSRRQIYMSLVQAFEEARISEVRDTPVLTVLQTPYVPPAPDPRGLLVRTLLGAVLGGFLGMLLAFLSEALGGAIPESDGPRAEFRRSWDGLMSSLPLLGRLRSRRPSEASR